MYVLYYLVISAAKLKFEELKLDSKWLATIFSTLIYIGIHVGQSDHLRCKGWWLYEMSCVAISLQIFLTTNCVHFLKTLKNQNRNENSSLGNLK